MSVFFGRVEWHAQPDSDGAWLSLLLDYTRLGAADMKISQEIDFTRLDDTALFSLREQMRAELERLAPHSPGHAELSARYAQSTAEVNERARVAWATHR